MVEKCRILYKGDMISGSFYLFVAIVFLIFALILHYFTTSIGYQYLSIGFFMFFVYALVKGTAIYYMSRKRYQYYEKLQVLNFAITKDEIEYTDYRLLKKEINRRRYIWTMVISCVIAFLGIFSIQKGFIMGTSIPIALISGIEFGIGLLTEFRLREYSRLLAKYQRSH